MATYNTIYRFEVLEKITAGERVWVTDRQNKSVALLNDMDVASAVKIVNTENKTRRYEFWVESVEDIEE